MYESLKAHTNNFHLYVFAFDDESCNALKKLNLAHVTIVGLDDFEDEALLAVKGSRTKGEYCWTCTPSVIKYCLENYTLDSCTYLDADIYFFADPKILIDEMEEKSILLTEHRYTPRYDQSTTSGIYCVQFMTFKNTSDGRTVLKWWRDACLDWCYARCENGKFGDQKYLDDWPERFSGVHVLQNIGGGIAPWNIQRYSIPELKAKTVFYHFHALKFMEGGNYIDVGSYAINRSQLKLIYKPYIRHLVDIKFRLQKKINIGNTISNDDKIYWSPLKKALYLLRAILNGYLRRHPISFFVNH